jgi:hypothetical protein
MERKEPNRKTADALRRKIGVNCAVCGTRGKKLTRKKHIVTFITPFGGGKTKPQVFLAIF